MTQQDLLEMNRAVKALHESNDALMSEIKKGGSGSELAAKLDKINNRIDEIEAKGAKRTSFSGSNEERTTSEAKTLFFDALRGKAVPTADLKRKGLTIGDDTQAGYLAPSEFVAEILRDEVEFSPIRQIARNRPTTRNSVQIPKRTRTAAAQWTSETGDRDETQNPTFGLETISTHELYAMVKISKIELEDSVFDLEAFIREEYSEQFGLSEGTAFVNGNGVGKPDGVLNSTDIEQIPSAASGKLSGDDLISVFYGLKEAYLNNSTYVLSRSTLKTVRTLKDGTGQYLWSPGIRDNARPATILDRPYVTCPDMPSIAAGNVPILFGDFRRGYLIVDRIVIEVMVDPFSSKRNGMVEFSGRKRVGGMVVVADALKALKIAA